MKSYRWLITITLLISITILTLVFINYEKIVTFNKANAMVSKLTAHEINKQNIKEYLLESALNANHEEIKSLVLKSVDIESLNKEEKKISPDYKADMNIIASWADKIKPKKIITQEVKDKECSSARIAKKAILDSKIRKQLLKGLNAAKKACIETLYQE